MHLPNAAVAAEQKQAWRVIAGRAPRRAGVPRSWIAGTVGLFVAVLVLYVHSVQYEASLLETQREIAALKDKNTILRAQLATVENPSRVESLATNALAMRSPAEVVFMPKAGAKKATAFNRIPPPPAVVHEGF